MTDSPNPIEPKENTDKPQETTPANPVPSVEATRSTDAKTIQETAPSEQPATPVAESVAPVATLEAEPVEPSPTTEPAPASVSQPAPTVDVPSKLAGEDTIARREAIFKALKSASEEEKKPDATPAQPATSSLQTEPKPSLSFIKPPEGGRVKTDYLNLPKADEGLGPRLPTPGTTRLTSSWKLRWKVGDENVIMAAEDKIVIGRAMEGDNSIGFDLTPHGAYHFGVSRMHAVLTLTDGFLYLEDLNSTNGTRINGFQVTPKQKYRLRDGDEIEFARLRTTIKFDMPKK